MWSLRAIVFALAVVSLACAGRSGQGPARMLNGTMKVTDFSTGRFRIVGSDEVLTAPAGTPLEALDGRNVRVEVTAEGKVWRISDGGASSE